MRLFIHKLIHWEYWPTWLVYFPVFFVYVIHAIKARSTFYFSAVNPSFSNGGFVNTSKMEIYNLIPTQFYPKTKLIEDKLPYQNIKAQLNFPFPFIVKPDKGLRGIMVKKINDWDEMEDYHKKINCAYLVQEYIAYENEIGLFYVRYPNDVKGKITGIVEKQFLDVIGDGKSTIFELLLQDPRYELQIKSLQANANLDMNLVLESGKKINLVPYGNHNRGTKFIDSSHKITPQLIATIDQMSRQIDGFYYGRIDLKFDNWQELENGKNFSIVEINGALSEPAHIYDPKHNYFFGLKEIIHHFKIMLTIAMQNNKLGSPYMRFNPAVKQLIIHFREVAEMKKHV